MRLNELKMIGVLALAAVALAFAIEPVRVDAAPISATRGIHEGVASCAGSTCHGRQEATGATVRQNELLTWQDESSPAGAHVRAYRVLLDARSQRISQRLGMGPAQSAPVCLSCHADAPLVSQRGVRFEISEGVGCEACHGGSSGWLASHTAEGVSHKANVAAGMIPLDEPKAKAANCLDCHFGGKGNQFVTHRIMAAGHPRISFELDLFTALQGHHDEDADYRARKNVAGGVKTWAVGQAMAVERALSLFTSGRANDGAFPEFTFYDCRTCHRSFADGPAFRSTYVANPGRALPPGMPSFNDENMLMLEAAAKIAAPALGAQFERESRAFHASFATSPAATAASARKLAAISAKLADGFDRASFSRGEILAILNDVLTGASAARYTDYQGGAQAVMAVDTLVNALASSGQIERRSAAAARPHIDAAYAAVKDANSWRPEDLRRAFARVDAVLTPGK